MSDDYVATEVPMARAKASGMRSRHGGKGPWAVRRLRSWASVANESWALRFAQKAHRASSLGDRTFLRGEES
jgi:hypothetical protein